MIHRSDASLGVDRRCDETRQRVRRAGRFVCLQCGSDRVLHPAGDMVIQEINP